MLNRYLAAAALVYGKPWVVGGMGVGDVGEPITKCQLNRKRCNSTIFFKETTTSEILNPETSAWEYGPDMPMAFSRGGCLVALNDEESKHLLVLYGTAQAFTYDWEGAANWEPTTNNRRNGQ